MFAIMDPLTGETHHNVVSIDEWKKAVRDHREQSYRQGRDDLAARILKATGQSFALGYLHGRDPGDERDVGC